MTRTRKTERVAVISREGDKIVRLTFKRVRVTQPTPPFTPPAAPAIALAA
ncbi:hypothetical protein [Oceanibaculum sp.]|nr:hypothetical protein [Oceanibaculum sp.]MCH2393213.1 hypothetical protein [Oceanibaculum sp.]